MSAGGKRRLPLYFRRLLPGGGSSPSCKIKSQSLHPISARLPKVFHARKEYVILSNFNTSLVILKS